MAEQFDVHTVSFSLGLLAYDAELTIPIFPVLPAGGAIQLLDAHIGGAGTVTGSLNGPRLVKMTPLAGTSLGTPTAAGTLGTITAGSITYTIPALRRGFSITTPLVSPGTAGAWVGLMLGSGTILTGNVVLTISYIMGT
jgi:hypothetical protein